VKKGNRGRVTFISLPVFERALSPFLFLGGAHHVAILFGILTNYTFLQHCLPLLGLFNMYLS